MISGASGGFLSSFPVNLIPGESIPITIGAGGPAGPYETSTGGTTTFGSYLSCTGGFGYGSMGNCGSAGGVGIYGFYVTSVGGIINGGFTSLRYGSGGVVSRCNGCPGSYPTTGAPGEPGVVFVDVLY